MDTRSKIISSSAAPEGAVLVAGYFDVPGVDLVRAIRQTHHSARRLVAVVLPAEVAGNEILSQAARAQMAAALRMIDYVLIAAPQDPSSGLEALRERLKAAEVVCLDGLEAGHKLRLVERISYGQSR